MSNYNRVVFGMFAAVCACGLAVTEARAQAFSTPTGRNRPVVPAGADPTVASFVDPTVSINGPAYVKIGQNSFVAPFPLLKAGKKGTLVIGNGSDVQDNATIDATSGGVTIGDLVHVAHGATIVGPATIGRFSGLPTENGVTYDAFISFNAWIENAVIEPGALVNGLAKVTGSVTIPAGFQVLPGQLVQNQADLADTTKVAPLDLVARGVRGRRLRRQPELRPGLHLALRHLAELGPRDRLRPERHG